MIPIFCNAIFADCTMISKVLMWSLKFTGTQPCNAHWGVWGLLPVCGVAPLSKLEEFARLRCRWEF